MSRKLFGVCLFCIPVIFLLFATSVFALDWQLVDEGNPGPRGRYGMTYDTFKDRVILFGGDVGLLNTATDTWEYDGSNWEKKVTLSQPAEINASDAIRGMVHDAERDRVVLLLRMGGTEVGGEYIPPHLETWEYDGHTWTRIITQISPPYGSGCQSIVYNKSRKKNHLI